MKIRIFIMGGVLFLAGLYGVLAEGASEKSQADVSTTEKETTLTYWVANVAFQTDTDMGDTPIYKELEQETGVKIEFLHPPQGLEAEQFNLMIGSRDFPDLIESNWLSFPGGPEKAIQDDVILRLNDVIQNNAPHLKKYLDSHTDIDAMVKTDNGSYYVFPFIRGDDILMVSFGPMVRKDWLDDLGLDIPETIHEWEEMLIAFRNQKDAPAPLTFWMWTILQARIGSFVFGAYDVGVEFFQENGTVKYGPIEPAFKLGLATLQKWYQEGLLDPDFAAQDGAALDAKVTGGKTGSFMHSAGGGMGRYITTMKPKNNSFDLVAAPWPVSKNGDQPEFGMKDFPYFGSNSVAITTACANVKKAALLLDYGYSQEGHMLYNFGIEGESYSMVDGFPTYTDYITKNPDGLSFAEIAKRYMRSVTGGPFVQDPRYILQYYQYPQQKKALDVWTVPGDAHRVPPMVSMTYEESQKFATIMSEVNTYVSEEMLLFIMGQKTLDEFDKFVEQLKVMDIEEAIKIQQAALDRYYSR